MRNLVGSGSNKILKVFGRIYSLTYINISAFILLAIYFILKCLIFKLFIVSFFGGELLSSKQAPDVIYDYVAYKAFINDQCDSHAKFMCLVKIKIQWLSIHLN